MQETQVQSLGKEDPLEKEMATHSSILAWEIPWTEEPGGLQSMGLQRVWGDWAIHTSLSWVSRTLNTVSEPEYLQLISASKGGLMNTGQVREQSLDSWLLFLWTELKKGFSHDGEKRAIPQHLPVVRVTNHFSFSRTPFNLAPKALHRMKPINVRETGMAGYPKRATVWPPWGTGYWNWINRTATS